MASMFGLNGISALEAPHNVIAKIVQRLSVKVISSQGEIAMPMISADTYRLSIQVPESWPIPSAPRTSVSAMDVTWSLNSDVIAAMRTPTRPNRGLISTASAQLLAVSYYYLERLGRGRYRRLTAAGSPTRQRSTLFVALCPSLDV